MIDPILLVLADPSQRNFIAKALVDSGYRIIEAESGLRAIELIQRRSDIAAILTEITMPDVIGFDLVARLHTLAAYVPIVVLVRREEDPHLIQALDSGASEFLLLPLSVLRLKVTLKNIFRHSDLEREVRRVRRYAEDHLKFKDLIAKNPRTKAYIATAKQLAKRNVMILLCGEEGCEHEVLAQVIHRESSHRTGAFVRVQCLNFDNEPRAVQSWISDIKIRWQEGGGGSLLFANIDRLDKTSQRALLELVKLDGEKNVNNVRLMATTTVDIDSLATNGAFDRDFLAQFDKSRLVILPLRERLQDLEPLCLAILKIVIAETGQRQISGIGERALSLLACHNWPGNIAELESTLYRGVLLSDGPVLSPQDFPQLLHRQRLKKIANNLKGDEFLSAPAAEIFWDEFGHIHPLARVEKQLIEVAMHRYGGSASEVARRLDISRATLYRKMENYQISAKTAFNK